MAFNGEEKRDIQKIIHEEIRTVVKSVSNQVEALERQGGFNDVSPGNIAYLVLKMVDETIDQRRR